MTTRLQYARLTDEEWIALLTGDPQDEQAVAHFVTVKCRPLLGFIYRSLFLWSGEEFDSIVSEFYLFLSRDNWSVVRRYRAQASLGTYLSVCAYRHFLQQKSRRSSMTTLNTQSLSSEAEEVEDPAQQSREAQRTLERVRRAYDRLCERDRKILRYQVIEKRPYLAIADEMWPHVNSGQKEWRLLPPKRVQDTLAIIKKRAIYNLYVKFTEEGDDGK